MARKNALTFHGKGRRREMVSDRYPHGDLSLGHDMFPLLQFEIGLSKQSVGPTKWWLRYKGVLLKKELT